MKLKQWPTSEITHRELAIMKLAGVVIVCLVLAITFGELASGAFSISWGSKDSFVTITMGVIGVLAAIIAVAPISFVLFMALVAASGRFGWKSRIVRWWHVHRQYWQKMVVYDRPTRHEHSHR